MVWQTVLAGIQKHTAPCWEFHRETTFNNLPFDFTWADLVEMAEQEDRQPDGVAYHAKTRKLYLLEFSRAMDHSHTMSDAIARKGKQYTKAMTAFRLHQRTSGVRNERITIETLPFIFGVRGSVMEAECMQNLERVGVASFANRRYILTDGVRATIQAMHNMKLARTAALADLHCKQDAVKEIHRVSKNR